MSSADNLLPERFSNSIEHSVVEGMKSPKAYPFEVAEIECYETHISYVFLAGTYAYKIKKGLKTPFLDYSTLERRRNFCHEELRLDSRYSEGLYIGVVPVVLQNNQVHVEGTGDPVEYAVKMHRFEKGSLLSEQIDAGTIDHFLLRRLAETIAQFHLTAEKCDLKTARSVPLSIHNNLLEVIATLQSNEGHSKIDDECQPILDQLRSWAVEYFTKHRSDFDSRAEDGFIRECHGDLHLQNVVLWKGKFVPFDGIEFNDRFRWIDVASDSAFLAMDFAAQGHFDLSRSFVNDYLEFSGDYSSLVVLRYYLVYRSLIRAMVSQMNARQHIDNTILVKNAFKDCCDHIKLALDFTQSASKKLYITHGVSGSGKSTVSQRFVSQYGAIRVRSDTERKRIGGIDAVGKFTEHEKESLYSSEMSIATYKQLQLLARQILNAGYSVVVDATFLKASERRDFQQIALALMVPFEIIDCQADVATLRERIISRNKAGQDISDADLRVLEQQLATQEPLGDEERKVIAAIPPMF